MNAGWAFNHEHLDILILARYITTAVAACKAEAYLYLTVTSGNIKSIDGLMRFLYQTVSRCIC